MNPLVSIVVPTYKVESYLKRCVDSILSQDYRNLQVILVDDGSPDRCGEIIDEYVKTDNRVLAVHLENGGYGKAVNAGIHRSEGKYVSIVEPDDWLSTNMYSLLVRIAEDKKTDYVKANFYEARIDALKSTHMEAWSFKGRVIDPKEHLFELMFSPAAIWANLYRKSFLMTNGLYLNETQKASYQDIAFHFELNVLAKTVYVVDVPIYYYNLENPDQSMKKTRNVEDRFIVYDHIDSFLERTGMTSDRKLLEVKWCHEFYMYKRNFRSVEIDLKRYAFEKMKCRLSRMRHQGLSYANFSFKQKFDAKSVAALPFLLYRIFDYFLRWKPVSVKRWQKLTGVSKVFCAPILGITLVLEILALPLILALKVVRAKCRTWSLRANNE
jgi:glycosyltransferase involved in cell wall biosynthesis